MSILFITCSRIGDAVLSTGALDFACQALPNAPVVVACGPVAAPLFKDWPNLERIIEIHRKPFSTHWFFLWKETVKQPWQWVIDVRGTATSYLLRTQKRSIWRSTSSPCHRVVQMAQVFKFPTVPAPVLYASPERRARLQNILPTDRPVIALAPVANWAGKEWPQENFLKLLKNLTSSRGSFPEARLAFFASPDERPRIQPLIDALPPKQVLDFVGKMELLDIFVLFQKCTLFIGNDSGLMHLAAASGVPTLGLFGPSPEIQYAPYGPYATFVRTPESNEILRTRLLENPDENLMTSLTLEKVEEALNDFWQRLQENKRTMTPIM